MFAYCNNNPVSYYDSNGNMPQAVEDKIVHDKVLKEICRQDSDLRMRKTCIYYNKKDYTRGWGFCDLFNISTGEVWELKKVSDTYSCTTAAATAQLHRYVSGRLKHYPSLELFTPYKTHIAGGTTTFSMNGYIYNVDYYNEGNGILRYSYTKEETEGRKTAEALATVAIATAVIAYCAPSLLPGIATAAMYASSF